MHRVFIVAEAGVNHNGQIDIAFQMVETAANADADAIKFQTFKAANLLTRSAQKADYQKLTTGSDQSQFAMIKKLELTKSDHCQLADYCKEKGIEFLSSAFSEQDITFLDRLGLKRFKIPSGEITNLPYLRAIGKLNKKVILSTGMANLQEVRDAYEILIRSGTSKNNIALLHCCTEYPAPFEAINLRAMLTLKKEFGVTVGYSDHSLGIEVAIGAVALGAEIIEKHLTLDINMEGPDHKASLEPPEFRALVDGIRNIEKAIGNGIKIPSSVEQKNRLVVRKSIVAAKRIRKGDFFTAENIAVKRPGTGISPMKWDDIIGSISPKDYEPDQLIEL